MVAAAVATPTSEWNVWRECVCQCYGEDDERRYCKHCFCNVIVVVVDNVVAAAVLERYCSSC